MCLRSSCLCASHLSHLAFTDSCTHMRLTEVSYDVLCHLFEFITQDHRCVSLRRVCRMWDVAVARKRTWCTITDVDRLLNHKRSESRPVVFFFFM